MRGDINLGVEFSKELYNLFHDESWCRANEINYTTLEQEENIVVACNEVYQKMLKNQNSSKTSLSTK